MTAKSLAEAVYSQLFPGGAIPFAAKDAITGIDTRIREIELLAKGQPIATGEPRRLTKADSLLLTERIIELRDSCHPPMGYKEIMSRLGNVITSEAARNRYDDAKRARDAATARDRFIFNPSPEVQEKFKELIRKSDEDILPAAPAPIPPETPEQVEEATIRNSRIVQNPSKVKLSQEQKDKILEMHAAGKSYDEIKSATGIDGRRIVGVCRGQEHRERMAALFSLRPSEPQNVAPVQQEAATYQSIPGAEGASLLVRANPRGTPEEEKPEPKSISRAELDAKIWTGHKAGKTPEQISDDLCSEGYYYGKERVRRMLLQQGAEL